MFRRSMVVVVFAILAFGAAASSALARTKVVYAGGPVAWQNKLQKTYGAGVDNFLVNRVTINAGDSVTWNGAALSNGFHTVDIPALGSSDEPLIVDTGNKVSSNVRDAAGNPFWFDGKLDYLSFNPSLFGPSGGNTYDGTQRVESGLPLGKPSDFTVKFTTPGVYKYFCDVHYGMVGYVVVQPDGTSVPSSKQDSKTLAGEEHKYVNEAKRTDRTKPSARTVSVGASAPGGLEVFAMFPSTLRIKTGTTVKFFMSKDTRETHTATFGPSSYLKMLANGFNSSPLDPRSTYPSSPYGQVLTLNHGSHGNGFANTGALDRDADTPLPASGKIRFTRPGVYHFICLVHPFMRGTIVVRSSPPPFTG
jgi:plastocyanin